MKGETRSRARGGGGDAPLNPPPRVVIADEQPTVRSSARRLLDQDGFAVCGECSDAEGVVELALRERPDLCLIGTLIAGGGIRATARIATALPETAVVILSSSEDGVDLVD